MRPICEASGRAACHVGHTPRSWHAALVARQGLWGAADMQCKSGRTSTRSVCVCVCVCVVAVCGWCWWGRGRSWGGGWEGGTFACEAWAPCPPNQALDAHTAPSSTASIWSQLPRSGATRHCVLPAPLHLKRRRQRPPRRCHERQYVSSGGVLQAPAALQQAKVQLAAAAERLNRDLKVRR